MRSLSLYIVLVLIFLGFSKSFSISSKGTPYLFNQQVYTNFFKGSPASVILAGQFATGFLIKTYYHKYIILHGFRSPENIIVRTSVKHYKDYQDKIGLSIFRRDEGGEEESVTPLPPGSLYVGNPAFGSWRKNKSGDKIWNFHRAYKSFPRQFGWGNFRPDYLFYKKVKESLNLGIAFTGNNQEFGTGGSVTKKIFNHQVEHFQSENLKNLFQNFLQVPPWKIQNTESINPNDEPVREE